MKWLRWIGIVLGILVVILIGAAGFVFFRSNALLNTVYDVPEIASIELPTDEESLVEGERLYVTRGCGDCHGRDGAGTIVIDAMPFAVIPASNLTGGEGGIGSTYSDEDYIRAIRHGVDPEGKGYLLMPSHEYSHYSDADVGKMIAYMHSLEPVDNDPGEPQLGPIGYMVVTDPSLGLFPAMLIDHENVTPQDVEVAASVEYGEYLAIGCRGCHSANYSGGSLDGDPSAPPASNITFHESGLDGWTLDDFMTAMRTGVRPDGTETDPFMPWQAFSQLNDVELEAMYLYLQSVEPVPYDS